MKKVLVMGGSYFIGKKVVDVLLNAGYEVYTLNRGTKENIDQRVKRLICDRNDKIKMLEVLKNHSFESIIDISGFNEKQVEILYHALNKDALKHYVFISTSAVYDIEKPYPYDEEAILADNLFCTPYGINKIKAEEFLTKQFKETQTKCIILRPPYVYGEDNYAPRESFIFDHLMHDQPIIIPNKGESQLQFIYTTDLANIILKLMNTELDSVSIFNVGNKHSISMKEWVDACAKVVGKEAKIVEYDYNESFSKATDFFPFLDYNIILNVDKINEVYNEETEFIIGLEQAYQWYCENKATIKFREHIIQNEQQILSELGIKK
jgi:nucleoside-diphosphate-sugar epimerase